MYKILRKCLKSYLFNTSFFQFLSSVSVYNALTELRVNLLTNFPSWISSHLSLLWVSAPVAVGKSVAITSPYIWRGSFSVPAYPYLESLIYKQISVHHGLYVLFLHNQFCECNIPDPFPDQQLEQGISNIWHAVTKSLASYDVTVHVVEPYCRDPINTDANHVFWPLIEHQVLLWHASSNIHPIFLFWLVWNAIRGTNALFLWLAYIIKIYKLFVKLLGYILSFKQAMLYFCRLGCLS